MPGKRSVPEQEYEKSRSLGWVIALICLGSVGIGLYAFQFFKSSSRFATDRLDTIRKKGTSLTAPGCIEEVLTFRKGCKAMAKLCDALVPRAMGICLRQKVRLPYCKTLPKATTTTAFGAKDCKRRKKEGAGKSLYKACGAVYRMIEAHCKLELDPFMRQTLPAHKKSTNQSHSIYQLLEVVKR